MKIQFIASGGHDCPLVRISDFAPSDACRFKEALEKLAHGFVDSVVLNDLTGMDGVSNCRITALAERMDEGILVDQHNPNSFFWILSGLTWENVVGLVEPFCESDSRGKFQWLDSPSKIHVLFSPQGNW